MKVTVKVNLNVRVGKPSLNAPCYQYLAPGSILEVDGILYPGDKYEGIDTWYKDEAGNYYWSGGVEGKKNNIEDKEFIMNSSWQISHFGIDKIWNKTKGKGIKIAILDTGIMMSHPDILKDNIILTKNFLYDGVNEIMINDVYDKVGHGTHCAGIIAAQGLQSFGVAPEVSLLVGKITDSPTGISSNLLFKGIEWAYTNNADVISISLTVDKFDKDYIEKIRKLDSEYKGILVGSLTDLGDMGFDTNSFPTVLESCIGVGAVNSNYNIDEVTARSSSLDILGPGRDIVSTWNDGGYKKMTGCSMATPFVAGVISLILAYLISQNKEIIKSDIINYLKTITNKFAAFESLPKRKYPIIDPISIFNQIT